MSLCSLGRLIAANVFWDQRNSISAASSVSRTNFEETRSILRPVEPASVFLEFTPSLRLVVAKTYLQEHNEITASDFCQWNEGNSAL
jgi:hypothetical protein